MSNWPWILAMLAVGGAGLAAGAHIGARRHHSDHAAVVRLERERHTDNAVSGGVIAGIEGWRAWRLRREEKKAKEENKQ